MKGVSHISHDYIRLRISRDEPRLPRYVCMLCYMVNCTFTVSAARRLLFAERTDTQSRRRTVTHLSVDTQVGESRPLVCNTIHPRIRALQKKQVVEVHSTFACVIL